jgi:hypothetical protein
MKVVEILRDEGWSPVRAEEVQVREDNRIGVQKHLIAFQRQDLVLNGEAIEALVINSHDRSCGYQILLGVYRFVCSNGLITGDTFDSFKVRHLGWTPDEIIGASRKIISSVPALTERIRDFKTITLTQDEQGIFAQAAHQLIYDEPEKSPIRPAALLTSRRHDDETDTLWTTYNNVQENMMKGGLRGITSNGRRTRTRKVKSIDKNTKLNKALWTLAEKMAELKRAA